jgi:hypothetical protein
MRALLVAGLIVVWFCTLGCSGDRAEVSGTVKLNGKLIEEGAITFIPVEGTQGPGTGAVIRDGKYHIPADKGVTPGKNRVELRAFISTGHKIKDPTASPGATTDERVQAFPAEYNDRSTLVREVRAGSNTLDFDIRTESDQSAGNR